MGLRLPSWPQRAARRDGGVAGAAQLCFAHKAGERPGRRGTLMADEVPHTGGHAAGHTAGQEANPTGGHAGRRTARMSAAVPGISRRRFLKTLGLSGAGVVGLSGYGLAVEPGYRLNITRYRVSPQRWTSGLNLSIGVIADVHAGGPLMPADRIRAIAEQTNELKPDMIVLLGDFAASHKFKTRSVAPEIWAEALSVLKAPLGVHAVLGN